MSFELDEISCLRILDHNNIDAMMEKRQVWREIAQQRWVTHKQITNVITSRGHRSITADTISNLHWVAETLLTTDADFKLVVSINQAWVYANNLELFDQLDAMPILKHKTYTQAKVDRPRDTLRLKNSEYKFRTYFRLIKLTAEEKDTLSSFLINQQSHVRLSPSLRDWVLNPFNRLQDYFFVDYTTSSWLTMLNLVHSGLIRKTLHIITDK
jgi:hypothetical protein